jgi:aminoglycoside phosphotransferase (APT) family kinase protein
VILAGLATILNAGVNLTALNIPSEKDYVAAYCSRTGRREIPNSRFCLAFNFFRMAAIFHGIAGRALRGTASSPHASQRRSAYRELARIGWEITRG